MSVSYEGKSPGKLWYFWQKSRGIFETKQQKPLVKSASGTGISGGATYLITQQIGFVLAYLPIATAGLAGMAGYNAFRAIRPSDSDRKNRVSTQERWVSAAKYGAAAAGVFLLTPVLTTWVSIGAIAATGYFGLRSWRNWKEAANSMQVRNYVRDQEAKWVEHKKNGTLKKRISRALQRVKTAVRGAALRTGKWGGFTLGAAGLVTGGIAAAQAAGAAILPASFVSTTLGGLTAAAAGVGIGAAAAVYGAAAVVALAVPVGIVTGLVCRNKLREASPAKEDGKNRFYKGLSEENAADVRAPSAPANDDVSPQAQKPAAERFNSEAKKEPAPEAEQKPAPKPAPKPAASVDPEAEAMRKRAAEERKRARQQRR